MIRFAMLAAAALFAGTLLPPASIAAAPAEPVVGAGQAAAAPQSRARPRAAAAKAATEAARWREVVAAKRPERIATLSTAFLRDFPDSHAIDEARQLAAGAARAHAIQRDVGLSGDFFDTTKGNGTFMTNLLNAARGDAAAAFEVSQAFGSGNAGIAANLHRQTQWLHFAAELGHPRASWDLAVRYNRDGRMAEAAHFENRAIALGYKPPPRLPTRGY